MDDDEIESESDFDSTDEDPYVKHASKCKASTSNRRRPGTRHGLTRGPGAIRKTPTPPPSVLRQLDLSTFPLRPFSSNVSSIRSRGRDEVVADDFVHAAKEKKESYKSLLRLAKDASVISFDVGDGIGRRNQDGELDSSAPVRSDKRKECETWISRIKNSSSKDMRCVILLLHGPSGCGKTALIDDLCGFHDIHVVDVPFNDEPRLYSSCLHDLLVNQPYAPFSRSEKDANTLVEIVMMESTSFRSSGKPFLIRCNAESIFTEEWCSSSVGKIISRLRIFPCGLVFEITTSENTNVNELRRRFPMSLSPFSNLTLLQLNPVASPTVKRLVLLEWSRFNISKRKGKTGVLLSRDYDDTLKFIVDTCRGDLRSALIHARFFGRTGPGVYHRTDSSDPDFREGKDEIQSVFHSVGRILHSKGDDPVRGEQILHFARIASEEDSRQLFSMMFENAASFYESIDEYADSLEHLSDVELFNSLSWKNEDIIYGSLHNTAFLVSLAALTTLKHPVPSSFSPLVGFRHWRMQNGFSGNVDFLCFHSFALLRFVLYAQKVTFEHEWISSLRQKVVSQFPVQKQGFQSSQSHSTFALVGDSSSFVVEDIEDISSSSDDEIRSSTSRLDLKKRKMIT